MLTSQRKALIAERLNRDGEVIAKALAAELALSEDTIRRDLREMAAEGATILVSSHVMDEAARADRLALIRAGRILADGTVAELLARAGVTDLESAFLALSAER